MNLIGQCNEEVTIERTDGSRYEAVKALVSGKMIMIPDASIPIAPDDVILRALPSGLVERMVVTDPGFYAKIHGMPNHYQVKYRREGQGNSGSPGYVIHMSGSNSRLNINSTDNSTNIFGVDPSNISKLSEELSSLRNALIPLANQPEHYVAIGGIASAEIAAKEGKASNVNQALSALGSGAKWVLDVAKSIGVPVATEALKSYVKSSAG